MTTKAPLEAERYADETCARLCLTANPCRCIGYGEIVRAVMDAGELMQVC